MNTIVGVVKKNVYSKKHTHVGKNENEMLRIANGEWRCAAAAGNQPPINPSIAKQASRRPNP